MTSPRWTPGTEDLVVEILKNHWLAYFPNDPTGMHLTVVCHCGWQGLFDLEKQDDPSTRHRVEVVLSVIADRAVPLVNKQTSDGHHTFEELYRYRLLYNAALFNEWAAYDLYDVHKSRLHHDGKYPFDDPKWFIVVAELPSGQVSNHYRVATDWDLFDIPERDLPNVYDGHTPAVVAERLAEFITEEV